MEFKDRLKKLRQEKHISQQELANAIYVSRSAIAKWENGLGIPNSTSYQSLLDYFSVSKEDLPLNEEIEAVSISKNQKIRTLSLTIIILSLVIVSIIVLTFINAFMNGYGFTSKMAVGEIWANEECIQTSEYDFYYSFIEGENIKIIDHFAVTEKKLVGYQKELNLEEHKKTVYDSNKQIFGYVYSFKGEKNYYHIFISTKIGYSDEGIKINLLNEVTIKEDVIPVLHNSYFETNFELTEFYSNNELYVVE